MNKKTIDGVRAYYDLPAEVTDETVKKQAKGSLGEAIVNMNIATQNFKQAIGKAVPNVFKRYFKK